MNTRVLNSMYQSIMKHEGFKDKPYKDSMGIWTIWYGHNLEVNPEEQGSKALEYDVVMSINNLNAALPWTKNIDDVRRSVLIEMTYNMGIKKLSDPIHGFKDMLKSLQDKDYKKASQEMLDSAWAKEVGQRANDMAKVMEAGSY